MKAEREEAGEGERSVQLSISPYYAGQLAASCLWNSLDALQETYIVLYKLFPPNNTERAGLGLRGGGPILLRQLAQNGEKVPGEKQIN